MQITSSSSKASSSSLSPSFFMYSKDAAAVIRSECLGISCQVTGNHVHCNGNE